MKGGGEMAFRKRMNKSQSKRSFRKGDKVKGKNFRSVVRRGGNRL